MNKTFGPLLALRFFRFILHPSFFLPDHTSLPPEGVPTSALRLG